MNSYSQAELDRLIESITKENSEFVETIMLFLVEHAVLEKEDVENLASQEWCSRNLHSSYPILREVDTRENLVDQLKDRPGAKQNRYYPRVYSFFGYDYVACSQFYGLGKNGKSRDNRTPFYNWVLNKLKIAEGHSIGNFDSWEILSETTAIKTCDKSFFEHNGSGVPKGICWFFDADTLEPGENRQIKLVFEGTTYQGRVINDSTDRRRVRIFWNTDLGNRFKALRTEEVQRLRFEREGSNYTVNFVEESGEEEMIINAKEAIEAIKAYITACGFSYNGNLIENFYLSLKSKPFVILAGTSGTGKTRLVKLFAEAIDARYKLVPVRPDWSDSSDLFGHVDLNGHFIPGAILDFVKEAQTNPTKPYFLCLDEMNLARVEYYLSDFLSVIETRDLKNGKIVSDPLIDADKYGSDDVAREKYGRIDYPANLYVVGTVNMDETTFPFSKKVLDRANTIEFSYVDLIPDFGLAEDKPDRIPLPNLFLCTEHLLIKDCSEHAEYITGICVELQKINRILQKANAHVGYRVRDEIVFYMLSNKREEGDILPENEALDNAIMQKILPRIQGSSASVHDMLCELFVACGGDHNQKNGDTDSEKMQKVLDDAAITCRYRRSAEKLQMMVRRFEEDGFTSYWL